MKLKKECIQCKKIFIANQLENLITCCERCHGELEFETHMLLKDVIEDGSALP